VASGFGWVFGKFRKFAPHITAGQVAEFLFQGSEPSAHGGFIFDESAGY